MKPEPIQPGLIDKMAFALVRPWVLIVVEAFLLTPISVLNADVETGSAFLKINTGARPAALGGAYTAMARDVDSIYYNPSGLSTLDKREFGATHAQWLLDTTFDFVGYAQPTSYGTCGLGVTRLGAGKIEGRDASGKTAGGFQASDTAYAFSYAKGPLGGSVKFLRSQIAGYSAQTVAFDIGARHELAGRPLTLGAAVLNIGRGMQFLDQVDPLPLTASIGAAYRLGGVLNLALDVRRDVQAGRFDVGIGSEYALLPTFKLRAGYASQFDGATVGNNGLLGSLGGLGADFGMRIKNYRADYTFTPFGSLGNVQRLSLGARF